MWPTRATFLPVWPWLKSAYHQQMVIFYGAESIAELARFYVYISYRNVESETFLEQDGLRKGRVLSRIYKKK